MKKLFFLFVASLLLFACENDGDPPKSIELSGGTQTNQTVYADETSKSEGIKFVAKEAWTATVKEMAAKSSESSVGWLKLSAYEGKAGEYTLSLTLLPNMTGLDRKAEIRIVCGDAVVIIVVEQKGTTQSGEKPEPEVPGLKFITAGGKVHGGEISGDYIPSALGYTIRAFGGFSYNSYKSDTPVAYAGKNFDMTLVTPPSDVMVAPGGALYGTPSDVKLAWAELYEPSQEEPYTVSVMLTNLEWKSAIDKNYIIRAGNSFVRFIYASKDVVLSGAVTEDLSGTLGNLGHVTFDFTNYSLSQGWNVVGFTARGNADAAGAVHMEATTVSGVAGYKWVAREAESGVIDPAPGHSTVVTKINDKAIGYHQDYLFAKIGDATYLNKFYSEKEWGYLGSGLNNGWICHFTYNNGKVAYTEYSYSPSDASPVKTKYEWNGDKLIAVYDINYDKGYGMKLEIEYGDVACPKGNIDLNWLVANDQTLGNMSFKTPEESAIGVKSVPYGKLISKIVLTDFGGGDKYSATFTYRYVFDSEGYPTYIYRKDVWKNEGDRGEKVIYKFEY